MGGLLAKGDEEYQLTAEEHKFVESCFKNLSHNKGSLIPENLLVWSYLADPDYIKFMRKACFRNSENDKIKIKPFARHFYIIIKGNVTEKATLIVKEVFCNTDDLFERVTTVQMLAFVLSILRSYCVILSKTQPEEFTCWTERGVVVNQEDLLHYSHFILAPLKGTSSVNITQLQRWLFNSQIFCQIWKVVLISLCKHMNPVDLYVPHQELVALPQCRIPNYNGLIDSKLTIGSVMFLNQSLPTEHRHMWTLLFSSKLHGENFTFLVSRIIHRGPTIIVVKDECDYLFGGYAKTSWSVGPNFYGEQGCLLFTLRPEMCLFHSSGRNGHYQYLNIKQRSYPNGLGMGGQVNYWGLWLQADFITGQTSDTCTTFTDYKEMSGNSKFQVRHVEIWSVSERESLGAISLVGNDTVLLTRGEDKFYLEMAGHNFRSDGEFEDRNRNNPPNG